MVPPRVDVVLAGALLLVSLLQVLWVQPVRSPWLGDALWFGPLLAVVSVAPLAWRRVRPVTAALVASSLGWVPTDAFLFVGYLCVVLLFFAVGRYGDSRRGRLTACAVGLLSGTTSFLTIEHEQGGLTRLIFEADIQQGVAGLPVPAAELLLAILGFYLLVLVSYALGRYLAAEDRRADLRVAAERETARCDAVLGERERIVRELHDVVGHEVTLMSIQSEAAAQALELAPERAAAPVDAVRETARRASRELRAILDLLGEGDLPVAPEARGLEELAERAARLGIANRLVVTGEPWADAPSHWLAVNRIVQECLTNAGKHAPGEQVDLAVDWSEEGVQVQATNSTPTTVDDDWGRGLTGMAERARHLGGTFDVVLADGHFDVRAWLPASGEVGS